MNQTQQLSFELVVESVVVVADATATAVKAKFKKAVRVLKSIVKKPLQYEFKFSFEHDVYHSNQSKLKHSVKFNYNGCQYFIRLFSAHRMSTQMIVGYCTNALHSIFKHMPKYGHGFYYQQFIDNSEFVDF